MKLLIAIPALNEEARIAQVIEASIQARGYIMVAGCISQVDITVRLAFQNRQLDSQIGRRDGSATRFR